MPRLSYSPQQRRFAARLVAVLAFCACLGLGALLLLPVALRFHTTTPAHDMASTPAAHVPALGTPGPEPTRAAALATRNSIPAATPTSTTDPASAPRRATDGAATL